jgi:hypothetical protein
MLQPSSTACRTRPAQRLRLGRQPLGGVGEDQAAFPDEPEQRPIAEIVVQSWCPRSLPSSALMSSAVISRKRPRLADHRPMSGSTAVY